MTEQLIGYFIFFFDVSLLAGILDSGGVTPYCHGLFMSRELVKIV